MLKIYNTLTKQKEEFKPLNPPQVGMYMCGPTVYDLFHIGNARSFIMSDIIRRYLEYKGYKVKFVMNITDIDDKIIKKGNEEGIGAFEAAEKFTKAFYEDISELRIKKADVNPRATDHIYEIINMIRRLEEKGFAYNINGNVFYDVNKFKVYGKLSGKKTDELESGARIEINEEKKNPLDFTLWKKAKEGEPSWDSPWGKGRPGWHIECSAMGTKHLGETFDIHAGGNDLIFPHHENEIAQSEAATGKKFVNYWIHFGFLNINDEKMSKSLGNFFTSRDILKIFSAEALRLLFVQAHYRGPLNFTDELLSSADKGLEKIRNIADKINSEIIKNNSGGAFIDFNFKRYEENFESAMDDDFNTPQAVAVIFDFIRDVNKTIAENDAINLNFYLRAKDFLVKRADEVLGIINFSSAKNETNQKLEKDLINLLINLRIDAKKEKNFALADKIREKLSDLGIVLRDSKEGTTYKITNR
jgi:cysteinyl-tRNA synthetase